MTADIEYVVGDATSPVNTDNKLPAYIVHCCNDMGGFVLALSRKWRDCEKQYRLWAAGKIEGLDDFKLGAIQIVPVEDDPKIFVVNLIGQRGMSYSKSGRPPVRYDAFREGFAKLRETLDGPAVIHMPRMGCSLAGGSWKLVETIVKEELVNHGINVVVYDFPGGQYNP